MSIVESTTGGSSRYNKPHTRYYAEAISSHRAALRHREFTGHSPHPDSFPSHTHISCLHNRLTDCSIIASPARSLERSLDYTKKDDYIHRKLETKGNKKIHTTDSRARHEDDGRRNITRENSTRDTILDFSYRNVYTTHSNTVNSHHDASGKRKGNRYTGGGKGGQGTVAGGAECGLM